MTINVAFKTPDALVFATDGLASVFEDDEARGPGAFLSNMSAVEKLVFLNGRRVIAMFNGVGSLGDATLAGELRAIDARLTHGGERPLPTRTWTRRVSEVMWERAFQARGVPPTPLHVVVGGFDEPPRPSGGPRGLGGAAQAPVAPLLYEIKWTSDTPLDRARPPAPTAVLAVERDGAPAEHAYGPYYAGATAAVARFVEGFDPELQRRFAVALAGRGNGGPPGIVEELITLARAAGSPAEPLDEATTRELALRFTRRLLRTAFPVATPQKLAEHFSLQAAVDYTVFLAQCAYADENLSPTRHGPPRVGSNLQVACLERDRDARQLSRIRLDVRLQGKEDVP